MQARETYLVLREVTEEVRLAAEPLVDLLHREGVGGVRLGVVCVLVHI